MSTGSQGDAANLKKHEESPTATHSEVIRITSPIDENAGSSQIGADLNTLIPASKAHALLIDNTEGNDEEIETIIEKKLPNDKEKGLDIDSELDFELKWDDDTDLNEDQIDNAYKEIESTLTSIDESLDSVSKSAEIIPTSIETDHGHAEKEIPSPLTSIDEGLDSVSTNPTSTSIEKDPDNEEEEMESTLTSADEGLDSVSKDTEPISIEGHAEKEIKSPLTSIDECLDKVSKIIDPTSTSIEKDIDNEEEAIESTLTSIDEGPDSVSKNTKPISIKKNIDNKEKEMGSTLTFIDEGLDSVSKDTEPISIEGQAEKEIKSPLTSIHKGLDKVIKITDPTSTSIEKDIDNEEKEIESTLTSIDECLRSASLDTKTNLTVEKDLNNAGKEEECLDSMSKEIDPAIKCTDKNSEKEIAITISSQEKQLDSTELKKETNLKSAENDNDLEIFRCNINDNIDTNPVIDTNSMDVDNVDGESASKSVDDVLMQSEELSKTDFVAGNENETFNADTCVKMDLETKISPTASETNSLDEQLVYSDAEVPDIEDKDLLDEIDAQITETEKSIDELGIIDTENLQTPQEPSQSSKENEVYQKNIPCEVDDNPKEEINKTDLNLTCSSEMETSKYDINNEHKLDRPDVMIEIPTQEFIESFDDSGEISDGDEDGQDYEFHNDDINKPDAIRNAASVELNANLIVSHTAEDKTDIVQSVSDKGDVPKDASNTLLKDQVEIDVDTKKSADDVAAIDQVKIAVDTKKSADDVVKIDQVEITVDTKKSADDIAEIENMNIDTSATFEETNKLDDESISASNSNLETQLQPNEENVPAIEEKPSQADIILEANSEQQSELTAEKVNPTPELQTEANKEVKESLENQDLKELEESKATDIDPQPSTSKDHQEMSDEGQPSTSKDHQELSDEDQEVTDSLGLLAESSRVMDDEDEQEQEAEEDDDDDDFDQDDESNQMTAEHSEDSNAQHSETDVPKESMEVDESNDAAEPQIDVAEAQDMETDDHEDDHEAYEDAIDESSADKDFQIQIDEVVSEKLEVETEVEESMEATAETQNSMETQKAVEALLEDESPEETSDEPEAVPSVEETVKVSDSDSDSAVKETSKLRTLLLKASSDSSNEPPETEKKSPIKTRKLEISTPKHEINIVELEESSSEDDVQVCKQDQVEPVPSPKEVTSVPPNDVQVTATSVGETTDTQLKENVAISGLPKPDTQKLTKLNTEELTKTASPASESLAMPETTAPKTPEAKTPIDLGLEIFSLDSDDEDTEVKNKRRKKLTAVEIDKARETNKCINIHCTSDASVPLVPASISAAIYYAANQQRGTGLCLNCAQRMEERSQKLIEGVKDLTPFLNMDMCMIREELVEISDSDSEEDAIVKKDDQVIGEKGANFLEEQLADMFNETWKKYDMESRLLTAQNEISVEVRQLEEECKKIDAMLHECQTETDKLRNDLYDTFADERRELPSIAIFDTPTYQWSGMEEAIPAPVIKESRMPKRRLPPPPEPPAKRPPIPLGYAPLDSDANKPPPETKPTPAPPAEVPAPPEDDNADISVVKLSVESAPAGLPPPGVATRPPLRPNMSVYAMRNTFGAWHKVKIVEVQPKIAGQFTMCRVKFENPKNMSKVLPARCLAYEHPPDVRLTIGTRVVALFKDHRNIEDLERKEAYYSGIVAEIPNPVNNFRYLIFFDDGYAQYVQHAVTRLVCECAPRVWDEVHPFSRQFVRDYLRAYPERPMVRLHAGQSIKTEWNGKWWPSKVIQVDASLVHVFFEGKKEAGIDKTEWIYRGSTRLAPLYLELQAAERQRSRPLPRAQAGRRFNMPYVEYTRSDEVTDGARAALPEPATTARPPAQPHSFAQSQAQLEQEIRRQRAVAKKSTAVAPPPPPARDNVTSRVVYYSPKNAIKPHKWVPHACGPRCKRTDVLALKDLRTYNPLTKPLLSGWERHTLRFRAPVSKTAMYRAPCGRRIRNHKELHQYLQAIESDMSVDLFDFNGHTHCLAEFVLNKCIVSKKDLSHGKENVPVPCVNYYDDSLPEFCSYNTERTPTAGVPLNLDPEFLCGCDCTDDCADKTKCACWKMTLEGARTIGLDTDEVGYVYKRLPEPLPSGIYECNSRCKCRQTCLNRVAQHPLQLKLQVFKTANRGWGIRALNDVPKGAFLCVYAGNLLTDATANLDGLNEGDEYLAELDYIEVVEQMKEGFEEDIPEDAKKLDQEEDSQSSLSPSSDEEPARDADDDFRPAVSAGQYARSEYSKRLRKREKSKKAKDKEEKEKKAKADREKNSEDCITISDDEELREPARFAARAGMGGKEFISKYKSVRAHFGKDEACYIMDAKVQGNIGRYLNHSCTPNVFVQNVFVDTHDPRFPWVAFFALSHIKAGTELTWNYNYDVGSVPGKVLYCYCNAPNCRGRLL